MPYLNPIAPCALNIEIHTKAPQRMNDNRRSKQAKPHARPGSETTRAGGETPARRFADMKAKPPGYEQKGDIERPPFEGHPDHGPNKGRPQHEHAGDEGEVDTAGQHGQRPAHQPPKNKSGV
jgi:hypothetical protein